MKSKIIKNRIHFIKLIQFREILCLPRKCVSKTDLKNKTKSTVCVLN
jgi:hypothetical protein